MNEQSLFGDDDDSYEQRIRRAQEARDDAMHRVDSCEDDEPWKEEVVRWVESLPSGHRLSTDDIWEHLGDAGPHDNRALGPVMRRLAKTHLTNTHTFTPSVRRHMAPITVWERR